MDFSPALPQFYYSGLLDLSKRLETKVFTVMNECFGMLKASFTK